MTRFPQPQCRYISLVALVVVMLWLAGCASQAERESDTDPAEAFTELGMAYLERGNLSRAMLALDRALERRPDDAAALQAMAIVLQRQGESQQAETMFQRALETAPDSGRTRNNYAAFLYEQGRLAPACEQLEIAARDTRYANRAQLFANLGQCQWELGETEQARHSLARAHSLDPRYPRGYLTMAELELEQGDLINARQQLERFINLTGMTPAAQTMAERIDAAAAPPADSRLDTHSRLDTARDAP